MSVYKKLTPSDVNITPFNTHKQYTYNSSSAGQNGVTFYSGQYSSQSIDFYEKYDVLGSKKYFQLDELYYNDFKLDIANMFGNISYRKTQRTLYDKVNILSIPSALYGYQIRPTTFYLSGSFSQNQEISRSAIVTDDGKGNLVTTDYPTGLTYFRDVVKRLMYVGPDKAFKQYNLGIYNHDNRNRPRHIGEPIVNAPTSFNTPSEEYVYDDSYYFNQLAYKDITFSPLALTGSYNYPGIKFNGFTSYIQSPHNEKFDFNPEDDFAISFWIVSPQEFKTQYIIGKSTTKTVVAAPQEGKAAVYNLSNTGSGTVDVFAEPQFPFEIYTTEQEGVSRSIYFDRFDGTNKVSISSFFTSNGKTHIHCQKTGSEMEIYINAVKQASGFDTTVKHTQNKANVYIGTKGNRSNYFSGSLSQIMIYEDAFTQTQINSSYNTITNTPIIGNIIYPHGIATITKPEYQGILKQHSSSITTGLLESVGDAWNPPSYFSGSTWNCNNGIITVDNTQYQVVSSSEDNLKLYIQGKKYVADETPYSLECYYTASNDYQLKFQASHLIYENEVLCTCDENEFNNTNNVTTRKIPTIDNQDLANFATSSLFRPYVTTVGLYNDDNELLMVGKLGQPVRMSDETDTTFVIRYDT